VRVRVRVKKDLTTEIVAESQAHPLRLI
jgi:hypothetical protein